MRRNAASELCFQFTLKRPSADCRDDASEPHIYFRPGKFTLQIPEREDRMKMSLFKFAGSSAILFRGLAIATATFLSAGCQDSPATNATPAATSQPANGTAAPVAQVAPVAAGATGAPPAARAVTANQSSEPRTADDVLMKMFQVYRDCRSYRDTGVMTSILQGPLASGEKTEKFTTLFMRPARFRFTKSWLGEGEEQEQLVWRNGSEFQIRWNTRPQMKAASLDDAIGHGRPQSYIIAALLMADVEQHSMMHDTVGHTLAGEEPIDEHPCWHIEAHDTKQQPARLWIDQQSLLLRQFRHSRKSGAVSDERTITWQPEVNVDIPDSALQLDPPSDN